MTTNIAVYFRGMIPNFGLFQNQEKDKTIISQSCFVSLAEKYFYAYISTWKYVERFFGLDITQVQIGFVYSMVIPDTRKRF